MKVILPTYRYCHDDLGPEELAPGYARRRTYAVNADGQRRDEVSWDLDRNRCWYYDMPRLHGEDRSQSALVYYVADVVVIHPTQLRCVERGGRERWRVASMHLNHKVAYKGPRTPI